MSVENDKRCVVTTGMTQRDVRSRCGMPTGTGTQPKFLQMVGCHAQGCSAPVDEFKSVAIMYDCQTEVSSVKSIEANAHPGYVRDGALRK